MVAPRALGLPEAVMVILQRIDPVLMPPVAMAAIKIIIQTASIKYMAPIGIVIALAKMSTIVLPTNIANIARTLTGIARTIRIRKIIADTKFTIRSKASITGVYTATILILTPHLQ